MLELVYSFEDFIMLNTCQWEESCKAFPGVTFSTCATRVVSNKRERQEFCSMNFVKMVVYTKQIS